MSFPEHWLVALSEGYACAKTCADAADEIRRLKEQLRVARDAEDGLRREWWMNHACKGGQYGDDGEMQCCGTDFKRTPLSELRERVTFLRLKALAAIETVEKSNG